MKIQAVHAEVRALVEGFILQPRSTCFLLHRLISIRSDANNNIMLALWWMHGHHRLYKSMIDSKGGDD